MTPDGRPESAEEIRQMIGGLTPEERELVAFYVRQINGLIWSGGDLARLAVGYTAVLESER